MHIRTKANKLSVINSYQFSFKDNYNQLLSAVSNLPSNLTQLHIRININLLQCTV